MNMTILSLILCLTFIAAMIRKNGGVLELKDKQWGGKPDPIDFALTFGSCLAGHFVRSLIF